MSDRRYILPLATAPLDLERAQRRYYDQLHGLIDADPHVKLECLNCHATDGVKLEAARTAYVKQCSVVGCMAMEGLDTPCANGGYRQDCSTFKAQPDPNAPIPLCRHCARVHHEEWDERWREHRSGQM